MSSSSKKLGAIATGHPETSAAARIILEEGGNAFDAALGAMVASCVCEPVLSSMGGGGFLLAKPESGRPGIYDYFAQTPRARIETANKDFFPVQCDFGAAQQEFHIGMASIATPGAIKGLFEINRDLGKMPIRRIIEPALVLAREGVTVNRFQAYVLQVVGAIFKYSSASKSIYGSRENPEKLIQEEEKFVNPQFADTMETIAIEGEDLFYRGEIAKNIASDSRFGGGNLTRQDFEKYEVIRRHPLVRNYKGTTLLTNPPPSSGGVLIAFALALLDNVDVGDMAFGSGEHMSLLVDVMKSTDQVRIEKGLHELHVGETEHTILDPDLLELYRNSILEQSNSNRGTTHISVVDGGGNAASMTMSNGEGAGYIAPGTGIMLNNMLGEDDINPFGFHRWPTGTRMSSMMAPSITIAPNRDMFVLGSGGSNRIRTAILQVLINLLEFSMPLSQAIGSPRLHTERAEVDIEGGFDVELCNSLSGQFGNARLWEEKNLFFGGVHGVFADRDLRTFDAAGDIRRGGCAIIP